MAANHQYAPKLNPLNLVFMTHTQGCSFSFFYVLENMLFLPSKQREHIIMSLILFMTDLDAFVPMSVYPITSAATSFL